MNATGARRVVITTLSLTAVLAVIRNVSAKEAPDIPKLVIGVIFAGVVLTLAADPAPELAAAIASLILVGAIVGNGPKVWEALSKNALSGSHKARTASTSSQTTKNQHARLTGGVGGALGPAGPVGP